MTKKLDRRTFIGAAVAFGALAAVNPTSAFGVTAAQKKQEVQAVKAKLEAMQSELDAAVDQYNAAQDAYATATAKVAECEKKIAATQSRISELQGHLESRAVAMYRNGSINYMDVVMGTDSFEDFASVWDTLENLNAEDANLVVQTKAAKAELENTKAELDANKAEAKNQVDLANSYKAGIEAKTAQYTKTYNSLSAEYKQLLKEEEEAAARAAAAAAAAYTPAATTSNTTSAASSGGSSSGGSSSGGSSSGSSSSGGSSSGGSSSGAASSIPTHGSVVDYAASRIGCPYVWGAAGPSSFDCSGLVMWCYAQIGISLPHYTESQFGMAKARISPSAAAPGDVLYHPGHVGISTGGISAIEAMNPSRGVCATTRNAWSCALRF